METSEDDVKGYFERYGIVSLVFQFGYLVKIGSLEFFYLVLSSLLIKIDVVDL